MVAHPLPSPQAGIAPATAPGGIALDQQMALFQLLNECAIDSADIRTGSANTTEARARLAQNLDALRSLAHRHVPGATQEEKALAIAAAFPGMPETTRQIMWRALVPTDRDFLTAQCWAGI